MATASAIHGVVTRRSDQPRSGRAINAAVEVIGDRWSLLVLHDVMFGNRRQFRILQERFEEGIASNVLADRLWRLVADGLLTWAHAGGGHRAEYRLTEEMSTPVTIASMRASTSIAVDRVKQLFRARR